jgi:hypothetical protein
MRAATETHRRFIIDDQHKGPALHARLIVDRPGEQGAKPADADWTGDA